MIIQFEYNENTLSWLSNQGGTDGWIVCEKCLEPIRDISDGIVAFDRPDELPAMAKVGFFHKIDCDPNTLRWNDLSEFLQVLRPTFTEE